MVITNKGTKNSKDNTIVDLKRTKSAILHTNLQTVHTKLKIKQHDPHQKL